MKTMTKKTKFLLTAMASAALLVACGGGGGSGGGKGGGDNAAGGGGTPGGGTATATPAPAAATPTPVPVPAAGSIDVNVDTLVLPTSGQRQAILKVTTLDASNNVVSGVPVKVELDSGVFTPTTADGVSDPKGVYEGTIAIGSSKKNREIRVKVTANEAGKGVEQTRVVKVTGSSIAPDAATVPRSVQPGGSFDMTVKLQDQAGTAVVGETATFVSEPAGLQFTNAQPSDAIGEVKVTVTVPAGLQTGGYNIVTAALGTTSKRALIVSQSGGAVIPDVLDTTTFSSASLTANPTAINANSVGDTTNQAEITAKFRDARNRAIENVRTKFFIGGNPIGGGEQLLPESEDNVLYSDVSGQVSVKYIPGTLSSPTDGVKLLMCYGKKNSDLANIKTAAECAKAANVRKATLTVAGQPLDITLAEGNKLEAVGSNNRFYKEEFGVQIVDAAGKFIPNAKFTPSVDITHFAKGSFRTGDKPDASSLKERTYREEKSGSTLSYAVLPAPGTGKVWCLNEDRNRNGSLDRGITVEGAPNINEDINGNGLEPKKSDIGVFSSGGGTTFVTDNEGKATITVRYPQNVGSWLAYTIKVSANAVGSEGVTEKSFVTGVLADDVPNGSFLTPPFGKKACNQPD